MSEKSSESESKKRGERKTRLYDYSKLISEGERARMGGRGIGVRGDAQVNLYRAEEEERSRRGKGFGGRH